MQQVSITPDPNEPTFAVHVTSTADSFAEVEITLGITKKYQTLPEGLDALILGFATAMKAWAGCDHATIHRISVVDTDITPADPA